MNEVQFVNVADYAALCGVSRVVIYRRGSRYYKGEDKISFHIYRGNRFVDLHKFPPSAGGKAGRPKAIFPTADATA